MTILLLLTHAQSYEFSAKQTKEFMFLAKLQPHFASLRENMYKFAEEKLTDNTQT